jgi:hypothetical protein
MMKLGTMVMTAMLLNLGAAHAETVPIRALQTTRRATASWHSDWLMLSAR